VINRTGEDHVALRWTQRRQKELGFCYADFDKSEVTSAPLYTPGKQQMSRFRPDKHR
jgi:hypothetical protein